MRTSLTDIRLTEQHLNGELCTEEELFFEARVLTNPELKANVAIQQKLMKLVKIFHRRQLRAETQAVHEQLFNDPRKAQFRASILNLFKH